MFNFASDARERKYKSQPCLSNQCIFSVHLPYYYTIVTDIYLTTLNTESQNGLYRLCLVSIDCLGWVSPVLLPVWLPGPATWLQTYPSWSAAARRGRWTRPRCCRKVSSNCNIKTKHSIIKFLKLQSIIYTGFLIYYI